MVLILMKVFNKTQIFLFIIIFHRVSEDNNTIRIINLLLKLFIIIIDDLIRRWKTNAWKIF